MNAVDLLMDMIGHDVMLRIDYGAAHQVHRGKVQSATDNVVILDARVALVPDRPPAPAKIYIEPDRIIEIVDLETVEPVLAEFSNRPPVELVPK
jgi:hypothetical protein